MSTDDRTTPFLPPQPHLPPRPYLPPPPTSRAPGAPDQDDGRRGRSATIHHGWTRFAASPWPRLAVVPALATLAVGIAAVPWVRALDVPDARLLLAIAAVAPVLVAVVVAGVARLDAVYSYAATIVALIIWVVAGLGSHGLGSALTHMPTQLLTETLPLTGDRSLLLVPGLVVWATGAITAELLIRSRRGVVGLGVPVLSFVLAFAATTGAPDRDEWTGPALLTVVVVLGLVRHAVSVSGTTVTVSGLMSAQSGVPAANRHASPGRVRRALLGAGLAAVVVAALAYGVPKIQAVNRTPASLARVPPVSSSEVVDPVNGTESLRDSNPQATPTPMLSVTTSAKTSGYFGIATLQDYNGDTWDFDTTFEPTGGRVPEATPGSPGAAAGAATTVRQTYRLDPDYDLPFVPALDRVRSVTGLTVDTDASTGMVVPAAKLKSGVTYSVVSGADDTNLGRVPQGDVIDAGSSALLAGPDLGLPNGTAADLSNAMQFAATITHKRPAATISFLQSLITALHTDERWVDPSLATTPGKATATRGGTSLAEVINAITVGRRATPEQFATLFVLIARDLGIPARVVTGFRVKPKSGAAVGAGTYTVTNREAWTWAEIPVEGLGWVVADATPTATTTSVVPTKIKGGSSTPSTTIPPQANAVPPSTAPSHQAVAPPVKIHHPGGSQPTWLVALEIAVGALLALLLLIPAVAGLRRLWRRRSRRRGPPEAQAAGAWLELLDALDLAGVDIAPEATPGEIATAVAERFGPELATPVALVGTTAEQAVFNASHPPDEAAAREAWAAQRTVQRGLRSELPRSTRLRSLGRVGRQARRPAGRGPGR